FFFQAEDGIRDRNVTGVQTCALPISYKIKNLLLNEPRGNKYVNLITYNINCEEQILEVFLDTSNIIDNRDILLKSFIASLVDRGRINKKMMYQLRLDGEDILYKHDELQISSLFEAHNSGE